ncbi:hypothetical protein QEJ31_10975 [Pigmentibacter sp. JX0631]|uniref:hypothetical protein n=1 Tax=Pigmentibacter sp. JX0631 TaxID=2976982 RepID=UPI00246952D6|nr:hypothetical protein [Pigmentibacter sp. JX0631]WGL59041.1 hypothetical protein QEJ31_10975 [Pigmentibacter sp. JX0631]
MKIDFLKNFNFNSSGRKATDAEIKLLLTKVTFVPNWYCELIFNYPLINRGIEISQDKDHSRMGIDLYWMSPEQTIEELFDYYPGINLKSEKIFPFGICAMGSGNPYFIDTNSSKFPVLRIIHDNFDENLKNIHEIVQISFNEFIENAFLYEN